MALGLRRREGGMARVPGGGGLKVRLWSWKEHKDVQLDPTKALAIQSQLSNCYQRGRVCYRQQEKSSLKQI